MDKELGEALQRYTGEGSFSRGLSCAKRLYAPGDKEAYDLIVKYRSEVTKAIRNRHEKSADFFNLLKSAYILTAQDYFEDYLIAVEWDRPYSGKFYTPRRGYLKRVVDAYQRIADGELELLTISMCKRAGKSQAEINFVDWLSGKYPDRSTLMEGAGDALINSFYLGCLEYLTEGSGYCYDEIFPGVKVVQKNADVHTINLVEKSRFPTIMCRSIDATQVGLSEATNVLVLDDCVEGYEEAQNKSRLREKWTKLNGDVIGRALEGTPIVASGTRYSVDDVIGNLQQMAIDKELRWESIEIPALDPVTDKSNYEFYNPKLNRPQFTTSFFQKERRSLSPIQWASEFQQEPFEAKGRLFPEERLNRYFELPKDVDPDAIIAACDTSEGKGDSTMMPIAYIYGEDVFIVDCVFSAATPEYTKPECAKMLVKHNVSTATFESNLAGEYFARDVQEMVKKMGGICAIKTKRTISSKQTRIVTESDTILRHFYFRDRSLYSLSDEYGQMMRELTGFTQVVKDKKHDDAPDGLALLASDLRKVNQPIAKVRDRLF